ncbi:uncharacterized protein LOC119112303 isoform X1 [Pollicipes pollicipes]|uniref:uncharacterized protein LOC119112303 isoform X1 n=1 Tax=Pollicipes pollicipes TaxID=41117 RepID=UPI001884FB92|nr:uncharacterized protein LOC119112303 isoform X1 [Pollicipes pollicipes]
MARKVIFRTRRTYSDPSQPRSTTPTGSTDSEEACSQENAGRKSMVLGSFQNESLAAVDSAENACIARYEGSEPNGDCSKPRSAPEGVSDIAIGPPATQRTTKSGRQAMDSMLNAEANRRKLRRERKKAKRARRAAKLQRQARRKTVLEKRANRARMYLQHGWLGRAAARTRSRHRERGGDEPGDDSRDERFRDVQAKRQRFFATLALHKDKVKEKSKLPGSVISQLRFSPSTGRAPCSPSTSRDRGAANHATVSVVVSSSDILLGNSSVINQTFAERGSHAEASTGHLAGTVRRAVSGLDEVADTTIVVEVDIEDIPDLLAGDIEFCLEEDANDTEEEDETATIDVMIVSSDVETSASSQTDQLDGVRGAADPMHVRGDTGSADIQPSGARDAATNAVARATGADGPISACRHRHTGSRTSGATASVPAIPQCRDYENTVDVTLPVMDAADSSAQEDQAFVVPNQRGDPPFGLKALDFDPAGDLDNELFEHFPTLPGFADLSTPVVSDAQSVGGAAQSGSQDCFATQPTSASTSQAYEPSLEALVWDPTWIQQVPLPPDSLPWPPFAGQDSHPEDGLGGPSGPASQSCRHRRGGWTGQRASSAPEDHAGSGPRPAGRRRSSSFSVQPQQLLASSLEEQMNPDAVGFGDPACRWIRPASSRSRSSGSDS